MKATLSIVAALSAGARLRTSQRRGARSQVSFETGS